MKKIYIKNGIVPLISENVSCIGFFDGIHKGHKKLIDKTLILAKKYKVKSSIICFQPDPIDVITGKKNKHIQNYKDRLDEFEQLGIEQAIIINFDEKLMKINYKDFILNYLNKFNINTLVCGFDYTFGYKGKGNINHLIKQNKFKLEVIKEAKYLNKKISSTRIRENIVLGNLKLVNRLLGHPYVIDLKVETCSKMANKWLIKTRLYDNQCILPVEYNNSYVYINSNRVYFYTDTKLIKNTRLYLTIDE